MTDPANPPPEETAGLQPGGSVDPGDTPPTSSQVSGALGPSGPDVPDSTTKYVVIGLLLVVALPVAFFLVYLVVRAMDLF